MQSSTDKNPSAGSEFQVSRQTQVPLDRDKSNGGNSGAFSRASEQFQNNGPLMHLYIIVTWMGNKSFSNASDAAACLTILQCSFSHNYCVSLHNVESILFSIP